MFAVINVICQIRKLSFFASITGMVLRCEYFFFILFVSSCHFNSIIYFIYAFCSRFLLLLYILLSSLNPVVIERSWRQNFGGVQVKNVANHSCVPPRESLKCAGLAESAFQRGCGRFCPIRCVYRPTALPREIPQACSHFLLRCATLTKVSVFIRALLHFKSAHFPEYRIDASLVILKHALCW